jgi:hypothetical protein
MKGVCICIAVLSLLLTTNAFAQETSFSYRQSAQLDREIGDDGGGGTRMDPTRLSNMPKPPVLVADKQFYGRAMSDCAAVLDKSAPDAAYYDALWLDVNLNKTFEDTERFALPASDRRNQASITVPVTIETEAGPSSQYFKVYAQVRDKYAYIRYSSAGYYIAQVKFGDKSHRVVLLDYNSNGRYDDKTVGNRRGDRILIDYNDDGKFENQYQREGEVAYINKYLYVDGVYYGLQVAPNGSSLTLTQPEVQLGKLQVEEPNVALTISGANGKYRYSREAGNEPFMIPVGDYVVEQATVSRRDGGALWSLRSDQGRGSSFTVEEGKEAVVNVGAPITASISVSKTRDGAASVSLDMKGVDGLVYHVQKDGNDFMNEAPKLLVKLKDGKWEKRYAFSFG